MIALIRWLVRKQVLERGFVIMKGSGGLFAYGLPSDLRSELEDLVSEYQQ